VFICVYESVKLMVEKLDPEQLGVVTFDTFVDEFYPGLFTASADNAVQPFTVYHYNGLKRSSLAKVIVIRFAMCLILFFKFVDVYFVWFTSHTGDLQFYIVTCVFIPSML